MKSAKLFESATEKHNLKKHLSLSVTVCYQKHLEKILWLKIDISIASLSLKTHSHELTEEFVVLYLSVKST